MRILIADEELVTRFLLAHDENYWHRVEDYIGQHASVSFIHGICPA